MRFAPAGLVAVAILTWGGAKLFGGPETATSGTASFSVQTVSNNQGIITQGQTGGTNTVVNRRPDRVLDDLMKNALLTYIPKTNKIKIMVLTGDPERDKFASQIDTFLRSENYTILSPHIAFLSAGTTPLGTSIFPDDKDNSITIIQIGVNDR